MEFGLTPTLRAGVRDVLATGCGGSEPLRRYERGDAAAITLADVQLLSRLLQEQQQPPPQPPQAAGQQQQEPGAVWVHQLLQGARPVLPTLEAKRAPHPDLAPRLAATLRERLRDDGVFLYAHTERRAIFRGPDGELQVSASVHAAVALLARLQNARYLNFRIVQLWLLDACK